MGKIGIVAGSFDPITDGHVWLIKKSVDLLGDGCVLYVVMGKNPAKKYFFDSEQRHAQISNVLAATLPMQQYQNVRIAVIENDLLINFARDVGAQYIFRGIRNAKDFDYETEVQSVNRDLNPQIETVFFVPPPELTKVSSSTVKGLVGFNGWEQIVERYVHSSIVTDFKKKLTV